MNFVIQHNFWIHLLFCPVGNWSKKRLCTHRYLYINFIEIKLHKVISIVKNPFSVFLFCNVCFIIIESTRVWYFNNRIHSHIWGTRVFFHFLFFVSGVNCITKIKLIFRMSRKNNQSEIYWPINFKNKTLILRDS